ncbi:hypothetical protein LXL04_027957 [Taraxacum kok-saghyz]
MSITDQIRSHPPRLRQISLCLFSPISASRLRLPRRDHSAVLQPPSRCFLLHSDPRQTCFATPTTNRKPSTSRPPSSPSRYPVVRCPSLSSLLDRRTSTGATVRYSEVYSNVRRDVLDECLSILGMERHSIEEIQRIEWKILDEKAKKWILAVKVVVRVLLFGEKRLCEQVFNESELIQYICFVETTKGCVMQLLNFGEAVAIGERSSEKLFRILDMYEETL